MADYIEPLSPLHHLAAPAERPIEGQMAVELSDRLPLSLIQIQAWPDSVAKVEAAVKKAADREAHVMPTGAGRWLVDSDSESLLNDLHKVIAPQMGALTDLSHARVVVSIQGEKAEWVMASGFALDFSLRAFPVGETRISAHHEIGATIYRTGDNSFDLYIFTSFARGFWTWITGVAQEHGYRVT